MSHATESGSASGCPDTTSGVVRDQITDVDRAVRFDTGRFRFAPGTTAAALLGTLALATPAGAQGVIATGSGRAGATVAAVIALIGAVVGGLALRRSARRVGAGGRDGALVALVTGLIGMFLAVLHLATSTGAIGTGNGRGGAIVALVLGLIGAGLGGLVLSRSRRPG